MAKNDKKLKKEEVVAVEKSTKAPTTREIKLWKDYLIRINTSPEVFLKRYPNHPMKDLISKIKI